MSIELVLEELERAENSRLHAAACRGLRIHVAKLLTREVANAALELAQATNDYEAALLSEFKGGSECCGEALHLRGRVKAMRQQQQWSKAAHLAEVVCILLYEAMGGVQVSADTAGIALSERERGLIEWLAREGRKSRSGSGETNPVGASGSTLLRG